MIKQALKTIVAKILEWEAWAVLKKYKPKVVGVGGNVGKTSTKEAVALSLADALTVRKSEKSYNSELGVPLTILGCRTAWLSVWGWLQNIWTGFSLLIFDHDYPDWLVLEVGADRPGDIKRIVKWVKFDVAVMTCLPEMPVHIEFFKSKEHVVEEKMILAKAVPSTGWVVINADDEMLKERRKELRAQVVTYGFSAGAEVRAHHAAVIYTKGKIKAPIGLGFRVNHGGKRYSIRLPGLLGVHQVYPVLAALTTGVVLGLPFAKLIESVSRYQTPAGRLRLLFGIKNTYILDDTYNSSPSALEEALNTLKALNLPGRKIAVIGDMLELGPHTVEAHREAGRQAADACDIIITIGLRAKFASDEALERKFNNNNIYHFDNPIVAGVKLQELIKEGDIILVKGSQGMRLEKTVEEIMAEPERKAELLVRQDREWLKRSA